jgi:uncharacterized protein YjbI with pentapeptide repeats
MASFMHAKLDNVFFVICQLRRAIFDSATILHSAFEECGLRQLRFSDVQGNYVQMVNIHRTDVPVPFLHIYGRINLLDAIFTRAVLCTFDFGGARMNNADFTDAKLYDSNFDQIEGENTAFAHADVRGSTFNDAALVGSDWTNATV